jgi:hypothetical protein
MAGDTTPVGGIADGDDDPVQQKVPAGSTSGDGPVAEQTAAPGAEPADSADAVTLAPPAASAPVVTPDPGLGSLTPTVRLPPPDYSQAGVPSLDFVRDKIEGRYAKSLGATELAQETPEARSVEEAAAKRAEAAKDKLDAIRRSLRGDSPS